MKRKNKEGLPVLEIDLTNPADARRFIRGFHFSEGNRLLYVVLADHTKLETHTLTDEQAVSCAAQLYKIYQKNPEAYFEDMH